ncbi:MAG TPA: serine/threonine-protein kinase [Kofleriaceae bacterium]|nr:serine/threonine-protein kinase [Kofleriaceae bacterium]
MSTGCPDAEEFAALLAHTLDSERRAQIIDHAAACADCHVLITDVAGTDTVASVDAHADTRAPGDAAPVRELIASVLQVHQRRGKIGRYHLLEIVGRGGMGVVWGAWDPELARRVALKLVHPTMDAARDLILAEGQALGKLSHPNVVPIYDVGVIDDQVYLVMEWVQGTTLRAYAGSPCSQRDLLDAYRQAGEGLAAAHRAGLIHRDFKPDNAIRGDDGRVRVLDFGLARSHAQEPEAVKRLAGTPRYMPPEQAAGDKVTPAADQYAFAFSLQEALTRTLGDRTLEVPSWMTGILARGTAPTPADRFPSMRDLLRALSRDPATIWRRRGIAAAAVATAAIAFVVGRAHSDAAPTCTGSAAEIARSWNPSMRGALVAHVRGLSAFGVGEAARLGDELDRYSAAWADEHHRACIAHESGELPPTLYERRIGCLARSKAALTAVAELMAHVGGDDLAPALIAARSLPSATGCTAGDASLVPPPPQASAIQVAIVEPMVERAIVLSIAGWGDALTLAKAGVEAAEKTGYAPLIARALVAQGRAELALNTGEVSERQPFEHALDLALRNGDDVLAVESYARLIYAVLRYRGDVVGNWSVMEAIAARTGTLGRFGRALLYNNKAAARIAANDRAGARALLHQALTAYPIDTSASSLSPTEKPLELISVLHNLAQVADDPAEREARIRQVVEQRKTVLGAKHPSTLGAWITTGTLIRNPDAAAAALQTALDGYRQWHPQFEAEIAELSLERGWLEDGRGDTATARAAMAAAAKDPLSPRSRATATIAAAYLQITAGDHVHDAIQAMQALALARLAGDPPWWYRSEAADAYVTAALGWEHLGRPDDAEPCWTSALTQLELTEQPIVERRLARVRAKLAQRWIGSKPDDARRLAREAIDWYRAAGGYETALAALVPIVTDRR